MPDIRRAGLVDDFERPDENPAAFPWTHGGFNPGNMRIESGVFKPDNTDCTWYYDDPTKVFNADCEIWGMTHDVADLTEAWRIGLLDDSGNGYLVVVIAGIGTGNWQLREYTGGTFVQIDLQSEQFIPHAGNMIMMRIVDDHVETWYGLEPTFDSWTKVNDVVDTTWRNNLRPWLGASSDDGTGPNWEEFGAGQLRKLPQIYRRPNE